MQYSIKIGKKTSVSSFDFNVEQSSFYVCSLKDNFLLNYKTDKFTMPEGKFRCLSKPSCLFYLKSRTEIVVGHVDGKISIFDPEDIEKGPICKSISKGQPKLSNLLF